MIFHFKTQNERRSNHETSSHSTTVLWAIFWQGVVCFEARSTENVQWWIEADKPAINWLVFHWSLNLFFLISFSFFSPFLALYFHSKSRFCGCAVIGIPCAYFLYDTMCFNFFQTSLAHHHHSLHFFAFILLPSIKMVEMALKNHSYRC